MVTVSKKDLAKLVRKANSNGNNKRPSFGKPMLITENEEEEKGYSEPVSGSDVVDKGPSFQEPVLIAEDKDDCHPEARGQ